MNVRLEVVIIPVSDVDRSKAFYQKLGWRLDGDFVINEKLRGIQFTPPQSEASIIFGLGVTSATPGSMSGLVLTVNNLEAARAELIAHRTEVSEIFHYLDFPFNTSIANARIPGRDPEGRSYFSFASFGDPDGNEWLLQEVTERLPGREWKADATEVPSLAELLRETSEHHDPYEKTHGKHDWWDWYAPYLHARQNGSTPEEACTAAGTYMDKLGKHDPEIN